LLIFSIILPMSLAFAFDYTRQLRLRRQKSVHLNILAALSAATVILDTNSTDRCFR
jgi:hypothetical protein